MAFIEEADLLNYIDERELGQITDESVTVIPEAVKDAIEYMSEMLRHRFDMAVEFAKVSPDRNRQLLKQTIAVTLYYINERIPTNVLPESREIAFENANNWLIQVQKGERQTDLTPIDAEEGVGHNISFGSHTKNSNNFI